nr:serine/threonine-protein kinase [Microbacterium sp. ZXX196]
MLGSGGFADVFLYEQKLPRRRVAIKVLLPDRISTSAAQFTAEANVMAMLSSHPAIVAVYQAGVASDGRPYLAMEYCPRANLQVRYRRERFAVDEALHTGIPVAAAVETAHRAHVLHRDIKPANILVTAYNRPALTDFGIASSLANPDESQGVSVPWSPPEAFADPPRSDPRSDVYQLGATVYTLLAGRSPFEVPGGDNGTGALIARIEREPVPDLQRADVPQSLVDVLARAMAKDPRDRFASAAAFARALQKVQIELGHSVTPIDILDDGEHDDAAAAAGDADDTGVTRIRSLRAVPATPPARAPQDAVPAAPETIAEPGEEIASAGPAPASGFAPPEPASFAPPAPAPSPAPQPEMWAPTPPADGRAGTSASFAPPAGEHTAARPVPESAPADERTVVRPAVAPAPDSGPADERPVARPEPSTSEYTAARASSAAEDRTVARPAAPTPEAVEDRTVVRPATPPAPEDDTLVRQAPAPVDDRTAPRAPRTGSAAPDYRFASRVEFGAGSVPRADPSQFRVASRVSDGEPPAITRSQRTIRRRSRRWILWVALATAVVLVAGAVVYGVSMLQPEEVSDDSTVRMGDVDPVANLQGIVTGQEATFTWENPSPQLGDSYRWGVSVADQLTSYDNATGDTSVTIDLEPGDETCIEVYVQRGDERSAHERGCVENPG